jgi:hypothetical protein
MRLFSFRFDVVRLNGRKPGMPLSILSNIAREAPLGWLLVAFLLGVAVLDVDRLGSMVESLETKVCVTVIPGCREAANPEARASDVLMGGTCRRLSANRQRTSGCRAGDRREARRAKARTILTSR